MQAARRTSIADRYRGLFALVAILGLGLDLITKEWAKSALVERDITVIEPWLQFRLVFNPGAAFSSLTGFTWLLTVVAVIAAGAVFYYVRKSGSVVWSVGLGFLQAGILGNLTNRIFEPPSPGQGHVVDFISLPNFPVFNVADICINIAAGLIIIQAWRGIQLDGLRADHE